MTLDQTRSSKYLKNTHPDLYEVDLDTGAARHVARRADGDLNRDWLVDRQGKVAVTLDFLSDSGSWKIRSAAGTVVASGTNILGGVDLLGFGHTPDTVLYATSDDVTGEMRWYEAPIAGGGGAREVLPGVDAQDAILDDRTRTLIGYRRDGDHPEEHFFDARQEKVMAATRKAFPGVTVRLVDENDAFDKLIVQTSGPGDPESWWLVDIKTGKAEVLGTAYPINSADVGPMRMVRYKATDGLDLAGVLTLPPGKPAKNLPVVMLPHGGPSARDYPDFNWWAQALASRGYAVFQPNFRGSTGSGAAFQKAGHGQWGRKMQSDISDGLAILASQGIVDPKRACIVGASYGGYAALAGVTLQNGLYRCAVSYAGVSDLARLYATDLRRSGGDRTLMRSLREEIGRGKDLRLVSPVNFAAKADAPVLLIHGKDDTVVLFDQSSVMRDALKRAGKPVELVTLPNEDHWLSRSPTRLAMLEATLAFLQRENPADP